MINNQNAFDSETVGIISIICLGASAFFGVLGVFVYAFVRICIFTFTMGIIIGGYALYLTTK